MRGVSGHYQTQLACPPPEGFQNDPVLGLVENLGISNETLLDTMKIYVGILAATILFIGTNAGVIGASRITYAMANYRQLPEVFRRVHPRFRTPWISLIVFAGLVPILTLLPGQVDFLGDDVLVRRDALVHDRAPRGDHAPGAPARPSSSSAAARTCGSGGSTGRSSPSSVGSARLWRGS